ncbi:Hypothetical predicted protein [Octopus vulgaris]|uniref:Uncharacterized protein n=1 Tax=Octopus vulgaris TaxID=6645 RepID=A0AA36FD69_OCTVU|nr:Hypothetical predicted protein [Octopus vulgaris]
MHNGFTIGKNTPESDTTPDVTFVCGHCSRTCLSHMGLPYKSLFARITKYEPLPGYFRTLLELCKKEKKNHQIRTIGRLLVNAPETVQKRTKKRT